MKKFLLFWLLLIPLISLGQSTGVDLSTQSKGQIATNQLPDTVLAKYWGAAPVFDATKYVGADMCAKILAVYSDAVYLASTNAIVDATGFSGSQNCASNMLATPRYTWIKLGNVTLHVTVNQAAAFLSSGILAAPGTPVTNTNTTTGGTLSNAVFIRTGYATAWQSETAQQFGPSAEFTASMNAACSGTPTCTETINSPATVVGAYAYNVYQSNTSGAEKKCNIAPIPLGETFKITANCTGVAINTANAVAFTGINILSGIGDNTQISLENAAASIDGSGTWNWQFKDMSIVSTLTTQSVNGMLQMANSQIADNITFSGGGNHLYVTGSMNTIRRTRHYGFTQTTGPVAAIQSFGGKWNRIEDTILSNFTFPVSASQNNGIVVSGCNLCVVDGVRSQNVDNSQAVNGGSMMEATGDGTTANASGNIIFTNFQCDGLINVNCADAINMTHDITISNGICRNTNNVAGVGANVLGADCIDIFEAGRWTVNNVIGQHRGGAGGTCCPTLEVYESPDGIVSNSHFDDDQGAQGILMNGSPNVAFVNSQMNRNFLTGINISDSASVVTCNGTTTVVWVSGTPFGPWNANTTVNIGAGPTAFLIASVTDIHTLVLTTTCGLGASQAFSVYSQDTVLNNLKADDNGQAGTGAGVRSGNAEGIFLAGHAQATVIGGSFNDNVSVAANKHQQYGIRMENNARARVISADLTGNGGGSNCLLEGNNVAGNHTYCDSPKTSAFSLDDNSGEAWTSSGTKRITANVSNSTTSMANLTGMFWTIAANRSYYLSCDLIFQAASTGGLKMAFTGPASPTQVEYCLDEAISASARADACTAAANTSFATVVGATTITTATTNWPAHFYGTIENGANSGTLQIQFASVASVSTTVERGSACTLSGVN